MPRISVVMASYNHDKYVAETIQSVLDQSYQDFEFIITDDGSDDDTVKVIKQFEDSRIKLFVFEENQGACVAMNNCIEHAEGEYIAVINSDDIWITNKLEKQVKFLDENPDYGAVFTYAKIIDENGDDFKDENHNWFDLFKQKNKTPYEWLNHFFYKSNALCHPSLLIRKKCYEVVGLYNPAYASLPDFDMWIRLCFKYGIFIIQENLIKFRKTEANTSGNNIPFSLRNVWERYEILKQYTQINSIETLLQIFPEIKKFDDYFDSELIPYYIAKLCLNNFKKRTNAHLMLGVNSIYNLLIKKKTAQKLKDKYNFTYNDFIKLTSSLDIFNIKSVREQRETIQKLRNPYFAEIYIDKGLGFNPKQRITKSITENDKIIEFDLSETEYNTEIKRIRIDPINIFCSLYIHYIKLVTEEDKEIIIEDYKTNAFYKNGNGLIYDNTDPQIIITDTEKFIINKIEIKLEFTFVGNNTINKINSIKKNEELIKLQQKEQQIQQKDEAINRRDKQIQQKEQQIQQKEQQIQQKEQQIQQKEQQIQQKDEAIQRRNQKLKQKDKELKNIYSSDLWKAATKLNKILHKTKLIYIPKALLILKREGIKGFFKKVVNKIRIRRRKKKKYNIIIKIPVPIKNHKNWGDYYFAVSLKKAFEKYNYKTHIQFLEEWYNSKDEADTIIVIRGLSKYKPNPKQFNIMWNISHPDKVSIDEYNEYDYVFVASETWSKELNNIINTPVEPLLQCTDPEIFKPVYKKEKETDLLFVGNSRKIYRKIIKDLIPTKYNLSVYGTLWDGIIDKKYIKGNHIPNQELHKYYSSCKILLNDHWDDMRKKGFISNRLFDGFASGAFIISDKVKDAEKIFGEALVTYETKEELHQLIDKYIKNPELRKDKIKKGKEIVIKNHTFENRVKRIIKIIKTNS